MNCGSITFYIFIAIASNGIYCGKHDPNPLYLGTLEDRCFTFQEVTYDAINKYYVAKSINEDKEIYATYPLKDEFNPSAIDIRKVSDKSSHIPVSVKLPIPRIGLSKTPDAYNTVGFSVSMPILKRNHALSYAAPSYQAVIVLIYFKFDAIFKRIVVLRYKIVGGQFLKAEVNREENNIIQEYVKNESTYGYNIDDLYSQAECPFVKVPLAPQEDFLFDSWKSASRQNILTAAMWRDLQPQWEALELFIRKVSRVIDSITLTAGVFGNWLKLPIENENSSNSKLRPPEYFWKAISLTFSHNDQQYNYGILFIMHNVLMPDPNSRSNVKKVCSEYDIANLGWKFLEDDLLKGPMYGCSLNKDIMDVFGGDIEGIFADFNLNSVSVLKVDQDGNPFVKNVNVVEEMGKLDKAENYDV